jgi:glycogen operon protein
MGIEPDDRVRLETPTPRKDGRQAAAAPEVRVGPGRPVPLGVQVCRDGFNFALFSRHADAIELVLFETAASAIPYATIPLDPARHRTGDIWHALVAGPRWGHAYAYRAYGPWAPHEGHRFDPRRLLLDPYALAIGHTHAWDFAALARGPDGGGIERLGGATHAGPWHVPKALILDRGFDWQGIRRPHRPWSETVIYETHVRGLTIHPSSGVSHPGTFRGLIDKIPYLLGLGVTAVELLPVQDFNERDAGRADPATKAPLPNYWGYDTVAFFAPKEGYAARVRPGCQTDEFKTMVRELHRAGIEIILDVAFNHTAEWGESGPTLSFRGLDNAIYYMLADDKSRYRDFTGCKNTLNCNHPVVRELIVDCLRYWAIDMQIDGFRFDLAAVLGRDTQGNLLADPPLLEAIAEDPILRDVKLIAEAWDAAGAYQVGSFNGRRWAEWNDRYRDDVRRFWRGDPRTTGALAMRLCGSADLFQRGGKAPINSINFVACHDGMTLNDVVSYARKHNVANGQENRDGIDENFSANYGTEGETDDPAIEALRSRQIKNMLATLFLSRGVPMLLGGDEFRRTQRGNNNAYCQDNATSWIDWRLAERNGELVRFVRRLIELRKRHVVLSTNAFYAERDIRWFGTDGNAPDWERAGGRLGCVISAETDGTSGRGGALCLLFNACGEAAEFRPPPPAGDEIWHVAIDTAEQSPHDAADPGAERPAANGPIALRPHSLVVLASAERRCVSSSVETGYA